METPGPASAASDGILDTTPDAERIGPALDGDSGGTATRNAEGSNHSGAGETAANGDSSDSTQAVLDDAGAGGSGNTGDASTNSGPNDASTGGSDASQTGSGGGDGDSTPGAANPASAVVADWCTDFMTEWPPATDDELFQAEIQARDAFFTTPITVRGEVRSDRGAPLPGAEVRFGDCAISATTGADGRFSIRNLPRYNREVHVTAEGYREEIVYTQLFHPVSVTEQVVPAVVMEPEVPGSVRFLFGGDVAFSRRFVDSQYEPTDPRDELPTFDPDALVLSTDPSPGSIKAMSWLQPLFLSMDFPVVNLESNVIDFPYTPHFWKAFVFFTFPDSLDVFDSLGQTYVSIGNNHMYDYLERGVSDTKMFLDQWGLSYSGMGGNADEAFEPHVELINGTSHAFLAMSSVTGYQSPPIYNATPDKGGAADLTDTSRVAQEISQAAGAGHVTVAQLHTGKEFSYTVSDYAYGRMTLAVDSGAHLVVSHGPHMAQGFSYESDVLIAHSLGNHCFDQERLETLYGLAAVVDMDGSVISRSRTLPIYLEDFRPRPLVGSQADYLLRRVGDASEDRGGITHNWGGWGWIPRSESELVRTTRLVSMEVSIGASGSAGIDLRGVRTHGESLRTASIDVPGATAQPGMDLLLHGDFEDLDVDNDVLEAPRWNIDSRSRYICFHEPYRGTAGLCSLRKSSNSGDSVVAFRQRVRVLGNESGTPNKDLTVFGYVRGDNAGPSLITVPHYGAEGEVSFGEEIVWQDTSGSTFDWTPIVFDLSMPPDAVDPGDVVNNARASRIFIRHSPPAEGTGVLRSDDWAIVSWKEPQDLSAGMQLESPNAHDFLKVAGPEGTHTLQLTFESQTPTVLAD